MNIKQGTVINGRYKILEKIGVGGMAVVYRAEDIKLDRSVTFKVLKEEFISDEDFIKRFKVEARAAAKLSHPNIVNVYDEGSENDIYYIVMEYIDGVTLKELVLKKAPFDNEEALSICIQIASALENAHKNNIVHRDIKPQNILVTREGIVKVTDFGIARAATSTTVTAESVGSVHYFSPEQARGGFVDSKSDIYSLGIVLYEMVTGELPFDGETPVALAMKHLREPIPNMREINPDISESVEKIIVKATQKSAGKRYPRIEDMNRDLKRATTDSSGNFIREEAEIDTSSQTIVMDRSQMDEIKNKSAYEDVYESDYDYEDDYRKKGTRNVREKVRDYDYDKKSERQVVIAAVATAIVIIGIISFIGAKFVKLGEGETVNAPDFKGRTWEEALEIAEQNEVYIKKEADDYSEDYKEGLIMAQDVESGKSIKVGSTVNITISKGSNKFKLPDVVDYDTVKAYEVLSEYNVKIKPEYTYSEEYKENVVIRQEPKSGEMASPGDTIILYISKGEEEIPVNIPDVVGENLDYARITLENKGFVVNIKHSESKNTAKGKIMSQNPPGGQEALEGSTVLVVVSDGAPEEEPKQDDNDKKSETNEDNNNNNSQNNNENNNSAIENNNSNSNNNDDNQHENELKTDHIQFAPDLSEYNTEDTVDVKVIDATNDIVVYSSSHKVSEFPLPSLSVTGSKPTNYKLYVDGKLVGEETKFQ